MNKFSKVCCWLWMIGLVCVGGLVVVVVFAIILQLFVKGNKCVNLWKIYQSQESVSVLSEDA